MPGLLLFLDFEKAFNTREWSFIQKTFLHFGFGKSLLNWIKVFYCNIEKLYFSTMDGQVTFLDLAEESDKAAPCRLTCLFSH